MKHQVTDISGIGEATAVLLAEHGLDSVKALEKGGVKKLMTVPGFGEIRANVVLASIASLKGNQAPVAAKASEGKKEKKPKRPIKDNKSKGKKDKMKAEKKDKSKKKAKKKALAKKK